ncbi:MAG: hypothetical protein RL591_956 [Planctomycetota bacterium]
MRVEDSMRPALFAIVSCSTVAAAALTPYASATIVLADGESVSLEAIVGAGGDRSVRIGDQEYFFGVFESHFAASGITLTARINDIANQFGRFDTGFDLAGGFSDLLSSNEEPSLMSIGFTVTIVLEAAKNGIRLCDAWMQFDGDASGVGSYAEVIENLIAPPAEELIGALEVFDRVTLEGDEVTRRKDAVEFCGPDGRGAVSSVIVEKTAAFFARPVGGAASASLIEQRFSEVPSPGALALACLAGLIGCRRRRV